MPMNTGSRIASYSWGLPRVLRGGLLNLADDEFRIARYQTFLFTVYQEIQLFQDVGPNQSGVPFGFDRCPEYAAAALQLDVDAFHNRALGKSAVRILDFHLARQRQAK